MIKHAVNTVTVGIGHPEVYRSKHFIHRLLCRRKKWTQDTQN